MRRPFISPKITTSNTLPRTPRGIAGSAALACPARLVRVFRRATPEVPPGPPGDDGRPEPTRWTLHEERLVDDTRRLRLSIAHVELPDGVHFEQYVLRMPRPR